MAQLAARTYAQALFEVALEVNRIDDFEKELNFVLQTFEQHPDFYEIFKTPQIGNEEKKSIIENVFKGRLTDEMMNFLKILLDKRRTGVLEYIAKEYHKLANEHNNVVEAVAVTTVPLKSEEQAKLVAKLTVVTGKRVYLKNQIDPAIIGGMLVRIGDQVIDGTIQSRLNKLQEDLAQIIV
ncbi:ATP synthase F1 subcomplex delta subunit [Geosporobacter subterraneus DSM 17957]|uniref:ATP synthase subunit delta n=1 Tax=Geosporobacter subterraneus DSM 17957 TaxID=1121919 RepID=A0A1M6CGJ3_9FIRM|nr:F0F1 ATP synthase subunit delta [Geosporobacter subterraneus]SHI60106.1 ATP synthase F1 subcomplex delta subunit [Geosporobacter subterraneus DSM 17957]